MCLFKRKKKLEIETKFHLGDAVRFRYRDELYFGWIYEIHAENQEQISYDVQVGGQCPMIIKNIKEEELTLRKE